MAITSMIKGFLRVPYLHGLSRLSRRIFSGEQRKELMFRVQPDGLYGIRASAFLENKKLLENTWQYAPTAAGYLFTSPDREVVHTKVNKLINEPNIWETTPVSLSLATAKALYAQGIRTILVIKVNTKDTFASVVRRVGRLGLLQGEEIVGEKGSFPPLVPGYYAHRDNNVLVIDRGETS